MRVLLLNQAFYPDVAATAQHAADLAGELARDGHEVTVISGRVAYSDSQIRFPAQETWRGIRILRVRSTSFGKGAKWRRAVDFASFVFFCCLRMTFLRRQDVVVAMTSPPLISVLAALFVKLKGGS